MLHFTLALCCCILLCVYVSCNSFPEYVQKRPRVHVSVLGLARGPSSEKDLVFSFGYTTIGETTVVIDGLDHQMKPPFDI